MERYPEEWFCSCEEDEESLRDDVSLHLHEAFIERGSGYYHCLLCHACQMTSIKTLKEHLLGHRHQRNYATFKQQQRAWCLDQLVNYKTRIPTCTTNIWRRFGVFSASPTCKMKDDSSTELSHIKLIRRWDWRRDNIRMVCQLCGTGEMETRLDVVHHCLNSQKHAALSSTRETWNNHHPELQEVLVRVDALPDSFKRGFQQHILSYIRVKEAAFAGLESQVWSFYHLLHRLEVYEIRANFVFLELAIWKASLLEENDRNTTDPPTAKSEDATETGSSLDYVSSFRDDRRTTCKSTEILRNVFPFLQTLPLIKEEYSLIFCNPCRDDTGSG